MSSFSIKDLLWLMLVVAICLQWALTNRLRESDLARQRQLYRLSFAICSILYDAVKSSGLKIEADEDGYYVVELPANWPSQRTSVSN